MPPLVACPTCRKETAWENNPHRPFCSERCQLLDLGSWTEGRYRIPGQQSEDDFLASDEQDDEKKKDK
jgi:endogenous inhibitor of DNA gyrase (YacG/DUF329 family)